jgi:pimeloyl-ACP methyl ester carboxylesterase
LTVYFISGLGADRRIFQKLILPPEYRVIHLDWVEPEKGESIYQYSQRISANIDHSEDFAIVGLSFGGMIATELSQIVKPKRVIILSSAGSRTEIPWYFRLAGTLRLDALLHPSFLKSSGPFSHWMLGANSREERLLLRQILKDTSPTFLKWAIRAILTWNRTRKPSEIIHIHGSKDRLLPARFVKADLIVPDGQHIMVYTLAATISKLITEKISAHFQ